MRPSPPLGAVVAIADHQPEVAVGREDALPFTPEAHGQIVRVTLGRRTPRPLTQYGGEVRITPTLLDVIGWRRWLSPRTDAVAHRGSRSGSWEDDRAE